MAKIKQILQTEQYTVVTEYLPTKKNKIYHETEAALEKAFINDLQNQGYEYANIKEEDSLLLNLRKQMALLNKNKLNNGEFSDNEWKQIENILLNPNDNTIDKTRLIQDDHIKTIKLDDGRVVNIYFIDKKNIHNNKLQVINQYEDNESNYRARYDVTILVNGLPLVHIELKRRGQNIKEAFNQIKRYNESNFSVSSKIFNFVQIFVISNGTYTRYYSNTVRQDTTLNSNNQIVRKTQANNNFKFTSIWTDEKNKSIDDLTDFTKTFFSKHSVLKILTKYCVFNIDKKLLVMRPYQIAATEKIINKTRQSIFNKQQGKLGSGGFIWHTTGSGKTLTSFKAARIVTEDVEEVYKVIFAVDRKDLDVQTRNEFNSFEKGAVNSNSSTKKLFEQIESSKNKIIVTTIQKLSNLVNVYKDLKLYNENVVFIFDEAHRSQFGEMHKNITKRFKKYILFGFTGTPIFNINANMSNKYPTTEMLFGENLHKYTIVDAIHDKTVLKFNYKKVGKINDNIKTDALTRSIDIESAYFDEIRMSKIVEYILKYFSMYTKRQDVYSYKDKIKSGFNSIFAVSSIRFAKMYYELFKKYQENLPENERLKVGIIYSYNPNSNNEDDEIFLDEDNGKNSADKLNKSDREFLDNAIDDYNQMFKSTYDSGEYFENYYEDVSKKMREKDIDILIVVNMFLTGFDAPTLNTLWLDKNLQYHGLIQAFSRTNRILNDKKSAGQIVSFRKLEDRLNDALALFGNKDANGIVMEKSFEELMEGFVDIAGNKKPGYIDITSELKEKFPLINGNVPIIESEIDKRSFVKIYSKFKKITNTLESFEEFEGVSIFSDFEIQQYQSLYIDLYEEFRNAERYEKTKINDDIEFEMELIYEQDINIDYIYNLLNKNKDKSKEEILTNIKVAIESSPALRSKRDLILEFIEKNDVSKIDDLGVALSENLRAEKENAIDKLIKEQGLKEGSYDLIRSYFENDYFSTEGPEISKILKGGRLFNITDDSQDKISLKNKFIQSFRKIFDKFRNL